MKQVIGTIMLLAAMATFADNFESEGGFITVWPKEAGKFSFVNAQTRVPRQTLAQPVRIVCNQFDFNFEFVDGVAPAVKDVKAQLGKLGATGAVWIVDDPGLPVMLGACEDGWAFLNVAPILADGPDEKKLAKRLEKYVARTFANIQGVGASTMSPHCVMMSAVGISGIDALDCAQYSPEPSMKINPTMLARGFKPCRRGTYYQACEEGWAPAPTNAVQKSIWEEVHKLPSSPIRIKPETKKVDR